MNQHGRSMIEMLGVLAIIGVLSIGGIAGFSSAMMKSKVNKTLQQISAISSAVSSLDVATYEGLNNKTVIKMKAAKAADDHSNIDNAFGGRINVSDTDNGASYKIELTAVPEEACIALLSHEWSAKGHFAGLSVNDTSVTPAKVASAIGSCRQTNTIVVKYQ